MYITSDLTHYAPVITANRGLTLRTRNYGYRAGTKAPIPGGSVYSCVTLYPRVPYVAFALLLRVLVEMWCLVVCLYV